MSADIQVRLADDLLLETLRDAFADTGLDVGVGDMEAPDGYGWPPGAEPNSPASTFRPYVVVTPSTASAEQRDTIGATQGVWHLPYLLQHFGVARAQARWMGDHARVALVDKLVGEEFDLGPKFKVQQIYVPTIGGVNRATRTDPPFYSAQDGIEIWFSRKRGS